MLKFIVLSLLSFNAFASDVILTSFARSGLMIPEDSFVMNCTVHVNGHVEVSIKRGNGTHEQRNAIADRDTIDHLQNLIEESSTQFLMERPIMCDAGDRNIIGYMEGMKVILEDQQDCEASFERVGREAAKARKIASDLCGF